MAISTIFQEIFGLKVEPEKVSVSPSREEFGLIVGYECMGLEVGILEEGEETPVSFWAFGGGEDIAFGSGEEIEI